MPASPVCLDTLVLATVGAAVNLKSMYSEGGDLSAPGQAKSVVMTALTSLVSIDIKHPLLLSANSHNILMRELFPQSKQNASTFVNSLKMLQNRDFSGHVAIISLQQHFNEGIIPAISSRF